MTNFEELLRVLTHGEVEFILIGGVAGVAHGATRLTQDLDIVYRRTPNNMARLVSAIEPFGPYLRGIPAGLPFQWSEATLRNGLNFTLTTSIGDLDLLGEITGGGGYEDLESGSITLTIFASKVRCLSLHQLISVKKAAGRPKDLEAIAELELLSEQDEL